MHHIDFASFWPGYDVSIYSRCATQITFALEPSANHLPLCGKCHQPCPLVHDRRTRLVRDRDLFELRVRLQVSIRRVDCLHCGCQILRYLVPGKGYLIRSPSSRRVIQFLTLCGALGFKARHIQLTLQLPGADVMQKTHILGQWNGLLQCAGLAGVPIEEGKQQDWPYLPKHDGLGVMEVRLLNSKLGGRGRRQRAFLSMMQLMLILSATLKPL